MGLVNLLSAVIPADRSRFRILADFSPLEVQSGIRIASALAGFALILLASGLWRHKRNAWLLTLVVLVISIVSHIGKGLDYEEALLAFAIGIVLVFFRNHFQARSDTPTVKRGLFIVCAAILFTLVYGATGFYFLDRHFSIHFNIFEACSQTIRMFTSFDDPGLIVTTRFGRYFADSIYVIGASTLGFGLLALLAPVFIRNPASLSDRERAEKIIQDYGRTVLARFCLFPDKQYFFSTGGSVISYVLQSRTVLVLGDPIGPADDTQNAIAGFRALCLHNDWIFSFYQTLPDYIDFYRKEGLRSIKIGEEAIINLDTFTLQGGEMKSIRTNVNKFNRLGWKSEIHNPPHGSKFISELQEISTEWLISQKGSEMKYSMGWFDEGYLNSTTIITIQNELGKIMAFANLVDEYQNRELAVDLMRHRINSPTGTMDFLFSVIIQYAKNVGYSQFNLGLSGLAGVGETQQDPLIERALHLIYKNVHTSYNFRGLHSFKEKFNPDWQPRYLIYPATAYLPQIAIALAQVS
jgi:phosphatidylglycerol lysyltransferase